MSRLIRHARLVIFARPHVPDRMSRSYRPRIMRGATRQRTRTPCQAREGIITTMWGYAGAHVVELGGNFPLLKVLLPLGCATIFAHAQPSHAQPSPDQEPPRIAVQAAGIRWKALGSIASANEYRDRILAREPTVSIAGGVASKGFAVSAWRSAEIQSGGDSAEVLFGYSYKLPIVDAHVGYVFCSNDRMIGGCPDAVRVGVSTNSISRLTLESSVDVPVATSRPTYSASATYQLVGGRGFGLVARSGLTRTDYGSGNFDGASIRLIGVKRLSPAFEVNISVGHSWVSGAMKPAQAQDGLVASMTWVGHL